MPYNYASTPLNIETITLRDMADFGDKLRAQQSPNMHTMEEMAQAITNGIWDGLVTESGENACALARLFTTLPYSQLSPHLQNAASAGNGTAEQRHDMKCLVLLGSAGDEPQWKSRHGSRGHQAIALPSEEVVVQAPMIANLFRQFGVQLSEFLQPAAETLLVPERSFNVFYVEDARNSPYIPAQDDFVVPYRIRSVVGFGGVLPGGELFAVILFLKVVIPGDVAALFTKMALHIRMALLPYVHRVFL
jgi:two-component system, NtrC family, sensor kinase